MNLKPRTYSVNELGKTQKYTVYNEIIGQEIFVNQNLITISYDYFIFKVLFVPKPLLYISKSQKKYICINSDPGNIYVLHIYLVLFHPFVRKLNQVIHQKFQRNDSWYVVYSQGSSTS